MRTREYTNGVAALWHSRHPLFNLLKMAKSRARKKGVPFSISEADLRKPKRCPILGIVIDYERGKKGTSQPNSPSIDRIIPARGYVAGNVRIVSHRANTLRSDAIIRELVLILADARCMDQNTNKALDAKAN